MPARTELQCPKCSYLISTTTAFASEDEKSHIQCNLCTKIIEVYLQDDNELVCPECGGDPTSGDDFDLDKFNCPKCGEKMEETGGKIFLHRRH